jgi:hypothetical protein
MVIFGVEIRPNFENENLLEKLSKIDPWGNLQYKTFKIWLKFYNLP